MLDFLKGYKLKGLGLLWAAAAAADGFLGIPILNSVDASNAMDNIFLGLGVFAGRDTVDTIIAKIMGEIKR